MPDSKTRSENTNQYELESLAEQCQELLPGVVWQVCQQYHRYHTSEKIEDYAGEILLRLLADDCRYLKTYYPAKASLKTWLTTVTKHELV